MTNELSQLRAIADYLRGLDNNEDADYLLSLAASLEAQEPVAWDGAVDYAMQYGGFCRDCGDLGPNCPRDNLPCANRREAISHVVKALTYGIAHGYIAPPTSAVPAKDDSRQLSDIGNDLHNLSCEIDSTNEQWADQISALALELWRWEPTSAVPEGFVLVPVEPTPEMLAEIYLVEHFSEQALQARYRAMISAAPQLGGDTNE